ncbi:MAG: hypothetical protein DME86_04955 [Verrucomicrobia bacterium]|nr:MAG: hypothetical protein DME86_04955 [Verrucomicrobiota bacterium]
MRMAADAVKRFKEPLPFRHRISVLFVSVRYSNPFAICPDRDFILAAHRFQRRWSRLKDARLAFTSGGDRGDHNRATESTRLDNQLKEIVEPPSQIRIAASFRICEQQDHECEQSPSFAANLTIEILVVLASGSLFGISLITRKSSCQWERELEKDFGIVFHKLCTITNLPIVRFARLR